MRHFWQPTNQRKKFIHFICIFGLEWIFLFGTFFLVWIFHSFLVIWWEFSYHQHYRSLLLLLFDCVNSTQDFHLHSSLFIFFHLSIILVFFIIIILRILVFMFFMMFQHVFCFVDCLVVCLFVWLVCLSEFQSFILIPESSF